MAERNPLVEEWILKADRYPGFDTSREEVLERKEMAGRLRQALLLRLGLNPQEPTQ